jgi:hypothetical protein
MKRYTQEELHFTTGSKVQQASQEIGSMTSRASLGRVIIDPKTPANALASSIGRGCLLSAQIHLSRWDFQSDPNSLHLRSKHLATISPFILTTRTTATVGA